MSMSVASAGAVRTAKRKSNDDWPQLAGSCSGLPCMITRSSMIIWIARCKRFVKFFSVVEGSPVHEEFKEETIVNKVGGRFKLSSLIQKRLVALNKGARPLVDMRTADKMAVVIQEIM